MYFGANIVCQHQYDGFIIKTNGAMKNRFCFQNEKSVYGFTSRFTRFTYKYCYHTVKRKGFSNNDDLIMWRRNILNFKL